jgi:predicted acyl esterase
MCRIPAAASHYDHRPGHWVAEPAWPSANIAGEKLVLEPGRLAAKEGKPAGLTINSAQITGAAGGEWCPYGLGGLGPELPTDQRSDDAWSLVFDGEVLSEPLEMLGAAVLDLDIASDQPVATLVARSATSRPTAR